MKVFKIRIEGDDNPNWHHTIVGKARTIAEAIDKATKYAVKITEASFTDGPKITSIEEIGDLAF